MDRLPSRRITPLDGVYIDLLKNPERFTGYSGESARRVWAAIYEQNCFQFIYGEHERVSKTLGSPSLGGVDSLCLEKRAFYRVISGT